YKELNTILNDCNTTIYGASIGGKTISKNTSFESPSILVMGSESHGISPELEQFLTKEIAIKKTGNAESLNVAIATSILLYELTK
ncbi:MAG: TrmH family RNA methyltransferase, partial [Flavobacteriales bacterium]